MKLLFLKNLTSGMDSFCRTTYEAAKSLGYEFIYASNFSTADKVRLEREEKEYGVKFVNFNWARSPFRFIQNYKAYGDFKSYVKKEKFDVVFCNTPIGGVMGRLAGAACKVPTVIYMAHGFHFYKGASKVALLYKFVEKWLARKTDILITMNNEDFEASKKFKLKKNGKIAKVNGVGIDISAYSNVTVDVEKKRTELGLSAGEKAIIAVGELNIGKNYTTIIKAMQYLPKSVKLFICGEGIYRKELEKLTDDLELGERVRLLGYRTDIKELLKTCDMYAMPSEREGLPRATMEAMSAKIPIVASKIRGNVDLIDDGESGFLVEPYDYKAFAEKINVLINDKQLCDKMAESAFIKVQNYGIETATLQIKQILGRI